MLRCSGTHIHTHTAPHTSTSGLAGRCVFLSVLLLVVRPLTAQVAMHPSRVAPAVMERFALRVASPSDTTVTVMLLIPDAVTVLGIESSDTWSAAVAPVTEGNPASIRWSNGTLAPGEFREFAFFGRLAGDSRRKELVFPVTLTRSDGDELRLERSGGDGEPPVVVIVGSTNVSPWGGIALAGLAFGISVIALSLAMSRRPTV